uniref:C2H2-type domain-containing protein n=1 Tax=Timema monikensis TaxID=170555 RepID=A0A7R9E4A1_9NEOP|nr:unnamed protein product [Timema monikensis]
MLMSQAVVPCRGLAENWRPLAVGRLALRRWQRREALILNYTNGSGMRKVEFRGSVPTFLGEREKDKFPMTPGSTMNSPQAIFTSFKLPKPSSTTVPPSNIFGNQLLTSTPEHLNMVVSSPSSPDESPKSSTPHRLDILQEGFYSYSEGIPCPDTLCPYNSRCHHFHCRQPRCFYVTDREDILIMHSKDFHDNIDILEGFLFFDRMVDCRLPNCHSNKVNRHFHCMHPGCGYSFVRYSTMAVHEQKHQADNISETSLKTQNTQHNICTSPSLHDMKKIQEEAGSPMSTRSESLELNSATPLSGNSPSQLRPPFVLRASSPESLTSKTTAVERSFSVNKECLAENLHEDSLIAQRVTYNAITAVGGLLNMTISKMMIHAVRNASGIRKEALEKKKKIDVDLVVKASGTFYPLSAFSCGLGPQNMGKGGVPKSSRATSSFPPSPPRCADTTLDTKSCPVAESVKLELDLDAQQQQSQSLPHQVITSRETSTIHPEWSIENHVQFGPDQSCGRPFCKRKQPKSFEFKMSDSSSEEEAMLVALCLAANEEAFSESERLKPHIAKHSSGALSPPMPKRDPEDNNNEESSDFTSNSGDILPFEHPSPSNEISLSLPPASLHPPIFPPHSSAAAASFNAAMAAAAAAGQQFALITSQGIPFIQPSIPAIYTSAEPYVDQVEDICNTYPGVLLIYTADVNAKSPIWHRKLSQRKDRRDGNDRPNMRGAALEELINALHLDVVNRPDNPPYVCGDAG